MTNPRHPVPSRVVETGSAHQRHARSDGTKHRAVAVAVTSDGRRVYVPNRDSGSVAVIDTGTNTVIATIAVGAYPEGIAVSPDGRRVYVPNYRSNSVSMIDTADNTVADTIPVGNDPWGWQ